MLQACFVEDKVCSCHVVLDEYTLLLDCASVCVVRRKSIVCRPGNGCQRSICRIKLTYEVECTACAYKVCLAPEILAGCVGELKSYINEVLSRTGSIVVPYQSIGLLVCRSRNSC